MSSTTNPIPGMPNLRAGNRMTVVRVPLRRGRWWQWWRRAWPTILYIPVIEQYNPIIKRWRIDYEQEEMLRAIIAINEHPTIGRMWNLVHHGIQPYTYVFPINPQKGAEPFVMKPQ